MVCHLTIEVFVSKLLFQAQAGTISAVEVTLEKTKWIAVSTSKNFPSIRHGHGRGYYKSMGSPRGSICSCYVGRG